MASNRRFLDEARKRGLKTLTFTTKPGWVARLDAYARANNLRGRGAALARIFDEHPELLEVKETALKK
jgi:hypothetical protein